MGKTDITKKIEDELFKYFFLKRSMRCALEVNCPKLHVKNKCEYYFWDGRVDFMALNVNEITCVEIKVSVSDFKSKHGHNLVGDKNYYAVSEEIAEKVIEMIPSNVGLYVYYGDNLKCVKKCKKVKEPLYKKATGHYGKTQLEMIKHNILTACNSRIYGYIIGKY